VPIGQSKTANTTVLSGLTKAKYDALLKTDKIVLVDFYADWCGPCKKMKPSIEEIAEEMKDKVVVVRIDADQNPDICKELSVDALPTLFVYKKGIMMWQNVGYVEKEEIVKYLK
jgi:thioredoxin 1